MKPYLHLVALVAVATFNSTPAFADAGGSCHFHDRTPTTEQIAVGCADKRKDALVAAGKLPKSWQAVKTDKAQLVDGKKGKEWRVSYTDPTATDKSKQTLYIILTAPGNFIAANFTGE